MLFRQFIDSESSTYSYLLACPETREALLIDPVFPQLEEYCRFIKESNLSLKYALDTHLHADHITALGALREKYGTTTVMGHTSQADCVSLRVTDNDRIKCGHLTLEAWYTPGHTDDSYCFVMPDRVFTGDTLLIRGTGRTDFQNGSSIDQYKSLQRLLSLPDERLVFPAHDYKGWTVSTIGEEKQFNPRLQVKNAQEYAKLMANLKLPNPKQMDVAIPANRACGTTTVKFS